MSSKDDGKRNDSDSGDGIAGTGEPIDGTNDRPIGDGDGTLGGGSRGAGDASRGAGDGDGASSVDGLGSSGTELGNASGDVGVSGGSEQPTLGNQEPPKRRGRPPKRDGSSRATGAGRSGTDTGRSGFETSRVADLGSQSDPKTVSDKDLGFEPDLSKLTKGEIEEAAAGLLQGVFVMIAGATGHDHWRLSDKEAAELGKAAWSYIKTLPTKQNKRFEKWLKEHAPIIKLAMVTLAILGPRFSVELQMLKLRQMEAENARRGIVNSGGGAVGTTGTVADTGGVIYSDEFIS